MAELKTDLSLSPEILEPSYVETVAIKPKETYQKFLTLWNRMQDELKTPDSKLRSKAKAAAPHNNFYSIDIPIGDALTWGQEAMISIKTQEGTLCMSTQKRAGHKISTADYYEPAFITDNLSLTTVTPTGVKETIWVSFNDPITDDLEFTKAEGGKSEIPPQLHYAWFGRNAKKEGEFGPESAIATITHESTGGRPTHSEGNLPEDKAINPDYIVEKVGQFVKSVK